MYSTSSGIPGQIIVKIGSLDEESLKRFNPVQIVEMYVKRRMPFLAPVIGATQFESMNA
jgi:hypothetical protein